MKRGVIYVCTGGGSYERATQLAVESLRRTNPELGCLVLSDRPLEIPSIVMNINHANPSRYIKTNLCRLSPYEETLYLDSDTLVLGDLSGIWGYLERSPVGLRLSQVGLISHAGHLGPQEQAAIAAELPSDYPQFNGGAILFRNNFETRQFFELWFDEWTRWGHADQGALARAVYRWSLNPVILPEIYNYYYSPYCNWQHLGIKVLHFCGGNITSGRFEAIARQLAV